MCLHIMVSICIKLFFHLAGQFWNIPIDIFPFDTSNPKEKLYAVSVEHPDREKRSFVGMLWPLTWEYRDQYCIYVGDGQAGPLDEVDARGGPNGAVVEGDYSQYKVDASFDVKFKFTQFNETKCF